MANAAPQLQEAFDLIESGDLQSARQLLEGIRSDYENNPDYWWIYAHAVENQEDGLAALDRVRQIAPNYPGLDSLFQSDQSSTPPPPPLSAPSTDDVEDYYETQPERESDAVPQSSGSPIAFLIAGAIAIIAVVLGLLFVANILTGGGDVEGTPQAVIVTDISPEPIIPSAEAESVSTETEGEDSFQLTATAFVIQATDDTSTALTQEAAASSTDTEVIPTESNVDSDPFTSAYDDLASFGVNEGAITAGSTESFGDTYLVTTCSALGPVATQNILGIIDALSASSDALDADISGFAFEITDCATDTVRLVLGLSRDTVNSYWNGDIDRAQLQQALQRVN